MESMRQGVVQRQAGSPFMLPPPMPFFLDDHFEDEHEDEHEEDPLEVIKLADQNKRQPGIFASS